MTYLVDTGVLLRAFDREAAEHKTILQAIRALLDRGQLSAVSSPWSVVRNCTRPQRTTDY